MVWGAVAGGLASGLAGSLLGAASGGGSSPRTSSTPWNADQLRFLQEEARRLYEQGPDQYYPGGTVAEMDPRLQQTLNQLMGFGQDPLVQAGQNSLMQALQGTQGLAQQVGGEQVSGIGDYASFLMNQAQGGDRGQAGGIATAADPTAAFQSFLGGSASNPYVDDLINSVTADLSRNLNENIMPRIDQGALAANAYGGSRQGIAQRGAIADTQRQASDAATQIRSTVAEADRNRQLQAANSLLGAAGQGDAYTNQLRQLGLSGATLGRGLFQDLAGITSEQARLAPFLQSFSGTNLNTQLLGGQAQQQYLQSLLSDDVNRFNFEQGADQQNLQQLASILQGNAGFGTTQTQNTPQASLGERLLGGASTGLGLYGQFQNLFQGNNANPWAANTPASSAYS